VLRVFTHFFTVCLAVNSYLFSSNYLYKYGLLRGYYLAFVDAMSIRPQSTSESSQLTGSLSKSRSKTAIIVSDATARFGMTDSYAVESFSVKTSVEDGDVVCPAPIPTEAQVAQQIADAPPKLPDFFDDDYVSTARYNYDNGSENENTSTTGEQGAGTQSSEDSVKPERHQMTPRT